VISARVPTNIVEIIDVETARSVLQLVEALDDHDETTIDDVQNASANFTIPDAALAALGKE
jgi:hypothetical protein